MRTAIYYNDPITNCTSLFVLATNADGTVDLGTDKKTLVVGKCKVSDTPVPGQCVLDVVAAPAA